MAKLKVGLVGIGRGTAYGRILAESPRTEVTALCDFNEAKLAENAPAFGLNDNQLFKNFDDFINSDVDIVVLGTPIPYHEEQVIKSLEAGKHVLCEVTAANTIQGCENIWKAVKKAEPKGLKYMLAENCNYMYFVYEWKEFVDKGYFGKLVYAEGEYVHEIRNLVIDKDGNNLWRTQRAPLHYCSHSLGPILHLMDDYIVRGTGSGKNVSVIEDVGPGAIDIQVALFETAKGATIKLLRSSVITRKPALCGYRLYGSKGFLETQEYSGIGKRYFEGVDEGPVNFEFSSSNKNDPTASTLGGHGTCEYYLIRDFLDSIENNTTPPIDIVKGLDMTIPGLIAHEAAMKGGVWMDMPLFYR